MTRFYGLPEKRRGFVSFGVPCTENGCGKAAHYAGHPDESVCSKCYKEKYKGAATQARCRHHKDQLQFLELGGCEDCQKRFAESPITQKFIADGLLPRPPNAAETIAG